MSIQLTPFAWVLCAMICALPVAAFVKTKYPALFVRARGRVSARQKCEESPSTPCESAEESFFARFIEQGQKFYVLFRFRRRRHRIAIPFDHERERRKLRYIPPQIFVHDLFIALFHHGRKRTVFRAAEFLLGVCGKKLFRRAVRFHPDFVAKRALR